MKVLFGDLYMDVFVGQSLLFISKLERVSFFPSLGYEESFPKHCIHAARLALTSQHPTHSRGKREQATGSDSVLNSAARQLQASCPHTCTHLRKDISACAKYVDAAGATFMHWKNLH